MAKKVAHTGVSAVFVVCVASAFGVGAALIDPTAAEYHFNKVQTQQAAQMGHYTMHFKSCKKERYFCYYSRGGCCSRGSMYPEFSARDCASCSYTRYLSLHPSIHLYNLYLLLSLSLSLSVCTVGLLVVSPMM